jgi:Flp pilus assembly pilin Flp
VNFWRCQSGATAIEYGLIVSLIVAVIVAGLTALGGSTHGLYGTFAKVAAIL